MTTSHGQVNTSVKQSNKPVNQSFSGKAFGAVKILAISALCATSVVSTVYGHARWKLDGPTPPRNESNGLKSEPCGNVARTNVPVTFQPGETIEVEWEETINHPGYFRISFSPQADEGFAQNVLLDNIPEVPAIKFYSATITLPNITCDDCTLQLIQVMTDRPNDPFYYSCADIRLEAAPINDTTPPDNITNLITQLNNTVATLAWTNPAVDFAGSIMVMSSTPITATPQTGLGYQVNDLLGTDQSIIFSGRQISTTVEDLTPGATYYFKAFAFDEALNYASGTEVSLSVPAAQPTLPSALEVTLLAEQNTEETLIVDPTAGQVIVQANLNGLDDYSNILFDWSESDASLVDLDTEPSTFIFEPSTLADGNYQLQVSITNALDNQPLGDATLTMQVAAQNSSTDPSAESPTNTTAPTERSATPGDGGSANDNSDSEESGGSLGGMVNLFALLLLGLLKRRFQMKR